jgi:hypothetical protein
MDLTPLQRVGDDAVGGGVSAVAELVVKYGGGWLLDKFRGHPPKAQQTAVQNAVVFLADLAQRLKILEEISSSEEDFKDRIGLALEDPDFTATVHTALLAASRTPDREKHDVLARLVADRLLADAESLRAVTTRIGVEAVGNLTSRQLRYLALAFQVRVIRPDLYPDGRREQGYWDWYGDWFVQRLEGYAPLPQVSSADVLHL